MKTIFLIALMIIKNGITIESRILITFKDKSSCMEYIKTNGESIVNGLVHTWQGQPLAEIGLYCKEAITIKGK